MGLDIKFFKSDGQIDGWIDVLTDRWTDAQMHRRTDGQMNRCTDGQTDRWTGGQMYRRTNLGIDGWKDELIDNCWRILV